MKTIKKSLKRKKIRKGIEKKFGKEILEDVSKATTGEIAWGLRNLSDKGTALVFEKLDAVKDGDIKAITFKGKLKQKTLKRIDELIADENVIFRESSIENLHKAGFINKEQKDKMLKKSKKYAFIVNK